METLQVRTEHSRSLEDADRYRAIQTLTELGLLVPLTEVDTYHGRVGSQDAFSWQVDPGFANGSDDSGNRNVNMRPTLYTSGEQVAKDFAEQRTHDIFVARYNKVFEDKVRNYTPEERQAWLDRENQSRQEWWDTLEPEGRKFYQQPRPYSLSDLDRKVWSEVARIEEATPAKEKQAIRTAAAKELRAEVHEIASTDSDATIIDLNFKPFALDDAARERYEKALTTLAIPITEGSPVSFDDRDAVQPFIEAMIKLEKVVVEESDVVQIAEDAGISEQTARQLCGAYNARRIAATDPAYAVDRLVRNSPDIIGDTIRIGDEKVVIPVNLEYVQRYLRKAHIVGVKQQVSSATLDRDIESVSLFDLEKVFTNEDIEDQRAGTWQRLGGLATVFSEIEGRRLHHGGRQRLLGLLTDAHAKPEKLIEAAKEVGDYKAIFEADAGNWEGFTLGEHTETVLNIFDENYADKLPVELLAPMRMAIITHDIGKSIAVADGAKHRQKEYNVSQAKDFMTKLGVDDRMKYLLSVVIGDGAELAYKINIRSGGDKARAALRMLADKTLQEFNGTDSVPEAQIESFVEMCTILQICDGGAYTSMAVTRSTAGNGRYRNAPSFNQSFAQPLGFGKRGVRLRQVDDKPAADDLTPR